MTKEKTKTEILNQTLDETEKLIQSTMQSRRSEIRKLTDRITAEKSRKRIAEQKAADSEDPEEIQKQAAEAQSAGALISVLENRLADTNGQELITPEEYNRVTREVLSAFEGERLDAYSRLRELAEQMQQIGQELTEAQNRSNLMLRSLQMDLNGNREIEKVNYAGRVFRTKEAHSVDVRGLIGWAEKAVNDYQYTGQAPDRGTPGKVWGLGSRGRGQADF